MVDLTGLRLRVLRGTQKFPVLPGTHLLMHTHALRFAHAPICLAVKLIQQHIMGGGESPGGALLHLLSMSSVCKQWRSLASELPTGTAIAFDCFDNLFSNNPAIQKFRRYAKKEQVFWSAARLLTGVKPRDLVVQRAPRAATSAA